MAAGAAVSANRFICEGPDFVLKSDAEALLRALGSREPVACLDMEAGVT